MKVKIRKRSMRALLLILLAIMMENLFYLIDRENINILGVFGYNYIWMFLFVAIIAYIYIHHGLGKSRVVYHFGSEIAFLACLVLIASVRGRITFGQSFLEGFIQQGCFFFIILSYFPIRKFYSKNIINDKTIDKGMMIFGIIAFIIYILQVQLNGSFSFLYVKTTSRYESARLYVDSIFCVMLGFYGMESFLRTKKWRSLVLVAVTIAYELLISKGRLEFLAFCVAMAIGVMLMKRYPVRKIVVIGGALGLIFYFLNSQYADSIFEAINNFSNNTGTMSIRAYGRGLYANRLLASTGSLLFGCGYPGNESAFIMSGQNYGVFLVDNGIFAFVYVYGIIGLIVVILWFVKMFRMAWELYRKRNQYIYLLFVIFNIGLMYNIVFWWWKYAWTLIMVIMMCKMEYYMYENQEEE